MPNLNKVMLIGNLTKDPELKYTPKGTAIAAFGLAVNRTWKNEAGEKQEEVTFINLEAYARLAEIIGEYCKKGNPIFVEGRLKLDTWEDKETQEKKSRMKVVVETMQLLGGKRDDDDSRGGPQHAQEQRQPQRQPQGQSQRRPEQRPAPPQGRRYAADPDLDAAPDDIPF